MQVFTTLPATMGAPLSVVADVSASSAAVAGSLAVQGALTSRPPVDNSPTSVTPLQLVASSSGTVYSCDSATSCQYLLPSLSSPLDGITYVPSDWSRPPPPCAMGFAVVARVRNRLDPGRCRLLVQVSDCGDGGGVCSQATAVSRVTRQ